jgi:hypothetical protein
VLSGAELGCHAGKARLQHGQRMVHGVPRGLASRLQEDRLHHREHGRRVQLGDRAGQVAQEVNLAALPGRPGEHLGQRTAALRHLEPQRGPISN